MHMPQLNEHHKKYDALVGEWEGKETIHPTPWDPAGRKATSKSRSRMDMGGFFMMTDYEQFGPDGKQSYKGHGVYGWDPRQEKFTMHWFDVMGGDPGAPALGTWQGNVLCFQLAHHMGHSRYTYTFARDGAYSFKIEMSQDGKQWAPFIDGEYTRVRK